MWLMTKHGFYSIVEKRPGEFHVRARERQDLENLLSVLSWRLYDRCPEIVETPEADYRYRFVTSRKPVSFLMSKLADGIDYPNFKAEIAARPDQRRKPYHTVWNVLARALGAYGSRGQVTMCTKCGSKEWTGSVWQEGGVGPVQCANCGAPREDDEE